MHLDYVIWTGEIQQKHHRVYQGDTTPIVSKTHHVTIQNSELFLFSRHAAYAGSRWSVLLENDYVITGYESGSALKVTSSYGSASHHLSLSLTPPIIQLIQFIYVMHAPR